MFMLHFNMMRTSKFEENSLHFWNIEKKVKAYAAVKHGDLASPSK